MKEPSPTSGSSLWRALRRALTPPPLREDSGKEQWRERILFFLLGPGLALGIIVYLATLPILLREGQHLVAGVDAAAVLVCLAVFLSRRLPYRFRACFLLVVVYCVGGAILGFIGPVSAGGLWLFSLPLVAGMLLGQRAALIGLGINALTLGGLSLVFYQGLLPWDGSAPPGLERWPVIALNFILLNAVTAIPAAMLLGNMEKAAERQRNISHELEGERALLAQEVAVRRRAQDALAESERQYRLVAENVSDAIWVLDLATLRLSYISPSAQAIMGYTPEEMYRLTLDQILAPSSLKLALDTLAEELALEDGPVDPGRARLLELQHIRKDGGYIWAEVPVRFMRDEQGAPVGLLGVSRDITARKLAQEALERSERRYRDLFDSISDIIYTQDLEGRFLSVNRATAELFGYAPGEMLGRKGSEFMLPEHRRGFETKYLPTLREKGAMAGTGQYLDSKGGRHYIEYRSTLVRPEEGEPYISGMGREVTERILAQREVKQLQAQLLQSQKLEAVGTLAGGIAHDFNNILAVMMGYTELALADTPPGDRRRPQLEQILRAGTRASSLVRQILSFSRARGGHHAPVLLQALVAEELELLRSSLPGRIKLETRLEAPGALVLADATQVRQVLMNLVTNAAQAMDQGGGELVIRLGRVSLNPARAAAVGGLAAGDYLRLEVRDSGPGMSPQVRERVFEPFFTTKPVDQGSGLGLAVVHGILKNHGGAVTVRSRPGQGAAFAVYLPCCDGQDQAGEPASPDPGPPGGSERILLVDDLPQILVVAGQRLGRLGYRVRTVNSGKEALAVFAAAPQDFDLVITDLTMPGLPGDELARRVGEIAPEVPVIIATGYGQRLSPERTPPNVRRVIAKPNSAAELARAVREALDPGPGDKVV